MSCNCGYPNPDNSTFCSMCGQRIQIREQDKHAGSMFGIPEYILYIYTLGQRKRLLKGIRFLTLFMVILTWLSFNLLAFTLSPLYAMWVYYYYNFQKVWRVHSYSRLLLCFYIIIVVIAGVASGVLIRGVIGDVFWWFASR